MVQAKKIEYNLIIFPVISVSLQYNMSSISFFHETLQKAYIKTVSNILLAMPCPIHEITIHQSKYCPNNITKMKIKHPMFKEKINMQAVII